jgi:hypothetical protein
MPSTTLGSLPWKDGPSLLPEKCIQTGTVSFEFYLLPPYLQSLLLQELQNHLQSVLELAAELIFQSTSASSSPAA